MKLLHKHYKQFEPASFMHVLYMAGQEKYSTSFNDEVPQQFPYHM